MKSCDLTREGTSNSEWRPLNCCASPWMRAGWEDGIEVACAGSDTGCRWKRPSGGHPSLAMQYAAQQLMAHSWPPFCTEPLRIPLSFLSATLPVYIRRPADTISSWFAEIVVCLFVCFSLQLPVRRCQVFTIPKRPVKSIECSWIELDPFRF